MKNLHEFAELARVTREKVEGFGITSKSVFKNFKRCVNLLSEYLEVNGLEFNLQVGITWLDNYMFSDELTLGTKRNEYLSFRRTIHLLWDNKNNQLTEWKIYSTSTATWPKTEEFVRIINDYRDYLSVDYAEETIKFRISCARWLLVFLEENDIFTLKQVDNKIVADFFASPHFENRKPAGVHAEVIRIKLFLEYLEAKDITQNKLLHYSVPKYRVQETKIVTTITPLAEEKILSDYPNLITNKREKAVCLLALNLGLRTCDIHNLKFNDINWDTGELQIRQQKTSVIIRHKIDNLTQNAIIDYILNERRNTECENIFVTAKGPITKLTGRDGNLRKRIDGIDKKDMPQQGLHILRRTFASKLLRIGTPLPVISSSLGHIDKKQVHCYLSTDDEKMKQCALSITSIPFRRGEF